MAKDGTQRGGKRAGSGKKPNSRIQRILDGVQPRSISVRMYDPEETEEPERIPELPEWATEKQHSPVDFRGVTVEVPELKTKEVFSYIWNHLETLGITRYVYVGLIQIYAMNVARWMQCEEMISRTGLLGTHPTTGADIISPYVSISQNYQKAANALWCQISQIIKDKWEGETDRSRNDRMEFLLLHG